MSVWLVKPLYELLPYCYMAAGAALLFFSWAATGAILPTVLLVLGCLSLLAGLTIWLRRRDYRTTQAQYNSRSLDD